MMRNAGRNFTVTLAVTRPSQKRISPSEASRRLGVKAKGIRDSYPVAGRAGAALDTLR